MIGDGSFNNNIWLLEVPQVNDVTLLCFPRHTTHTMQPLERSFIRPVTVNSDQEAKS